MELAFPRLELIGRDHAPPIVIGVGELRMKSPNEFSFVLRGTPTDMSYAHEEIRRQKENPYDGSARFRLVGIDRDGLEWSFGWTIPRIEIGEPSWKFEGEVDGLWPNDKSDTVSRDSTTEVIFLVPRSHPIARTLQRFLLKHPVQGEPRYEHVMEVLGSTIQFVYEPSRDTLSVTANHSSDLPPTHTENWLGEPLRILLGQLVYPRLVARNLGGGHSHISIRKSPTIIYNAAWVALWSTKNLSADEEAFWTAYAQLLNLIAQARDKNGQRNFEAHKITRLYEELIQVSHGSRWVWALTFASSVEGLAKMLIPEDVKPTTAESDAITLLVTHINAGTGDPWLKMIATNAVNRTAEMTTIRVLRDLKATGVVMGDQLKAWEEIRNSVMHGSLVSPYSSESEDAKLLALAAMLHALTKEILRRSAIS
ncbi:MAG: hypothetical protein HKL84_02765 [Acidimicrobiaceae bacterium]|nr:hypothetical protein [Acidimicrobiaceae bacterium]